MSEQPLSQDRQDFIVEGHSLPPRRGDIPEYESSVSKSSSPWKPRINRPANEVWLARRLEKKLDLLDDALEQLRQIVPSLQIRDERAFDRARYNLIEHLLDLGEVWFSNEEDVKAEVYRNSAKQLCRMVGAVTGVQTQVFGEVYLPDEDNLDKDDRSSALKVDFAVRLENDIGQCVYVAEVKTASVLDHHLQQIESTVYDVDVHFKPQADRKGRDTWAQGMLGIVLKTATSAAARSLEYAVIISETKFIPIRNRWDTDTTTGARFITVEVGNHHEILPTGEVGIDHPRSKYISFLFFLHLHGLGYGQAPNTSQPTAIDSAVAVPGSGGLILQQPDTSATGRAAAARPSHARQGNLGSDATIRGRSLKAQAPSEVILDFARNPPNSKLGPAAQLLSHNSPRSPAVDSGYGSAHTSPELGEAAFFKSAWPSHRISVAPSILSITKRLGQGKMGCVYLGELCGAIVAVKLAEEDNEEAQEDLEREAKVLQLLAARNVPSVPKFHGLYRYANGDGFIVMSFCGQRVEGGKDWQELDLATRKRIFNAHKRIHDAGIVHGDPRPENVLVTEDGEINVVDFHMSYDHTCSDRCTEMASLAAVLDLKKDDIED